MSDDLAAWLRAQLDDDAALIERNSGRKGVSDDGSYPDYQTYDGEDIEAASDYLFRFNPKRMLAEVDAKRRIVERCQYELRTYVGPSSQVALAYLALKQFALPYADRPGYRDEWKP